MNSEQSRLLEAGKKKVMYQGNFQKLATDSDRYPMKSIQNNLHGQTAIDTRYKLLDYISKRHIYKSS